MSDTTTIQQGWLETREGDKFAPNTLVENVYTRSGVKYDTRVREYIASIQSGTSSSVTALQQRMTTAEGKINTAQTDIDNIETKLQNINTDNDDTFWIIDNNTEVIAYIDVNGVHSFDFETKGGVKLSSMPTQIASLSGQISALDRTIANTNAAIKNFNGEDSEVLYIIDGNDRVIAYIDDQGVHSYNFYVEHEDEEKGTVDDYRTLAGKVNQNISDISINEGAITALDNRLGSVEDNTQYFNGNDDKALYIVDGTENKNVIAYFDYEGLHVINVLISSEDSNGTVVNQSYDLYATLVALEKAIDDELEARKDADDKLDKKITANEGNIAALMKAIDPDANENKLFFIDNNENVIAYIDEFGIHAVDLYVGDSAKEDGTSVNSNSYSVYDELTKLLAADTGTIADLQSQITALGVRIGTLETWQGTMKTWKTEVNTDISNIKKDISNLQTAVDTTLPNSIQKVADDAATNLSMAIGQEVTDRDAAIKSAVDAEAATRSGQDEIIYSILGEKTKITDSTKTHKSRLDNIETRLTNVSNVMDFVGSFETLPAAASYHKGDVCVVKGIEYVHDGSSWQELGDVTRLAAVERALSTETSERIAADQNLSDRITPIEKIVGGEGDTLYIIDGSNDQKVIAYFNEEGLTAYNIIVKNAQDKSKNMQVNGIFINNSNTVTIGFDL